MFSRLPLALGVLAIVACRRMLVIATMEGSSMAPTLPAGDRVLFVRWPRALLRTGQIVVARFPGYPPEQWAGVDVMPPAGDVSWTVKRIAARAGQLAPARRDGTRERVPPGHVFLLGDGARSLDSRDWGPVPAGEVRGVMLTRVGFRSGRQLKPAD